MSKGLRFKFNHWTVRAVFVFMFLALLKMGLGKPLLDSSELSLQRNPSSFWKYTKTLTKHNALPSTLRWDNTTVDNPLDSANLLSKYFNSMYNSSITSPFNPPKKNSYPYELPSNCHFTLDDVQLALNSLKNNNSNGPDGISARLLFNCQDSIVYKANYDKSVVTKEPEFKPGSNVLIQKNNMWFPGEIITKAPTPRSYIVRNKKGKIIRRNIRHLKYINNVPGNLIAHPSNHNEEALVDENRKDSLIVESKRPKRTLKKPSALNDFIMY
ncbi:hypothetical protein ACI65C_004616 [Semiaphis heraclei]